MITEKTLTKFGLFKDEGNLKLRETFRNNTKLKEVHIDIYPENPLISSSKPFMLLLRIIEKNVAVSNNEDRIVLKKSDRYGTNFMNVLFSEITECCYKTYDGFSEFILSIQNIYYRITVFN